MEALIHSVARLILAVQKTWDKKWTFLVLSLCMFFGSATVLAEFDLLPNPQSVAEAAVEPITQTTPEVSVSATAVAAATASLGTQKGAVELPVKIVIPAISLSATVANPTSTAIEVLDNDLLLGAVRYPTSAKLGEVGNVVIFGHSSYLPIVHNQAYKTFDGIQKLKAGNVITVYSSGAVYTYAVESVTKEDAASAGIALAVSGKVLTLATCDSFGSKSSRFVVVANLVESHLGSS